MGKASKTKNKVKTTNRYDDGTIIEVQKSVKCSAGIKQLTLAQIESFASRYAQTYGCWDWYGRLSPQGYGLFSARSYSGVIPAHRVIYELMNGYRPYGEVDHLCRNRRCVRPDHLQLVSKKTNMLRGNNPAALNARKTHCVRGHEYSKENTWVRPSRPNHRECKKCKSKREKDCRENVRNKSLHTRRVRSL